MSPPRPREDRTRGGVLVMLIAVALFTCIDTSAKWLALSGLPVMQVVFARYFGHFVYALVLYLPQEGLGAFRSSAPRKQALRSCLLLGSTTLNFLALQSLPITVTTTIFFAGPIVVTLLAIPILGERVGIRRIVAVCTGFIGVLVVTRPWGAGFHPAMLYSIAATVIASLYFIMTRMLAGAERNATQQIWASGLPSLALAPVALSVGVLPETASQWGVLLVIGFFGLSGHVLATIAHTWADASVLAPMVYAQVFYSAVAGVLVFATWPTVWTLGGGGIIIAAGLYIWHRERSLKQG